jgi:hypothetical protein
LSDEVRKQNHILVAMSPQQSLQTLKSAVAQRFNWRILTGDKNDYTRFVIEKQVHYQLIRGWRLTATYQIIGGFQANQNGETVLSYAVSGQPGVPFFHTAFNVSWLLFITFLLASFVFSPTIDANWVGVLLLFVLLATIVLYGWYSHRSYQGHLNELNRFMQEFAQCID